MEFAPVKVNDRQLADLLDEVAAGMRADVPNVQTFHSLGQKRLGGISKLARRIEEELQRGCSLADAFSSLDSAMLRQTGAAIGVAEQTGNERILVGLARSLRSRAMQRRASTIAWFYPIVLLLVVYATAVYVATPTVLTHDGKVIHWPEPVVQVCRFLDKYPWAPLAVFGVGLLAWVALGRKKQISTQTRISLFCQTLADQMNHGVPDEQALVTASQVTGEHPYSGAKSFADLKSLLDKSEIPVENVPGASDQQRHVAKLRYLASEYETKARRTQFFQCRVMPRIATVLIGGGGLAFYVLCIILPVYREVAKW